MADISHSWRKRPFDVAIIGAGIVGCATAYYLAKRGASVCVIDRGTIASEQSSRAWGFIRQQGRHSAEVAIAALAGRLWPNLEQELQADLEYVRSGILLAAETESDEKRIESAYHLARDHGIDAELIGTDRIRQLVPGAARPWRAGLYTPSDGHAEPDKTAMAFARAAEKNGADILQGVGADAVHCRGRDQVAVLTSQGPLTAHAVVCAPGASGGTLLRSLRLPLPVQAVRAPVAQTNASNYTGSTPVWSPHVAFRPKRDGTFYIGNGYREVDAEYDLGFHSLAHMTQFLPTLLQNRKAIRLGLGREAINNFVHQLRRMDLSLPQTEPLVNRAIVARNEAEFYATFPNMDRLGLQRVWAGRIDATPDLIPIIGQIADDKIYVAVGFNGHGFALAPAVGQQLTELILDGAASLDLSRFRPSRFKEGAIDREFGSL